MAEKLRLNPSFISFHRDGDASCVFNMSSMDGFSMGLSLLETPLTIKTDTCPSFNLAEQCWHNASLRTALVEPLGIVSRIL